MQIMEVYGPGHTLGALANLSKAHAKQFLTRKEAALSQSVPSFRLAFRVTDLPKVGRPAPIPAALAPSPTRIEPLMFQVQNTHPRAKTQRPRRTSTFAPSRGL